MDPVMGKQQQNKTYSRVKIVTAVVTSLAVLITAFTMIWYYTTRKNNAIIKDTYQAAKITFNDNFSWESLTLNDDLIIPSNRVVTFPATLKQVRVRTITIFGRLECPESPTFNMTMDLFSMVVENGGAFVCGTSENRFQGRIRLNVYFVEPDENISAITVNNGLLSLHGQSRSIWSRLRQTAPKGANTIKVWSQTPIFAGDEVVIAPTDFKYDAHEVRRVEQAVRIRSNKWDLTLNSSLAFTHFGKMQTYGSLTLDSRAEFAVLTRNIQIYGRNVQNGGVSIKIVGMNSKAYIDSIEIRFAGTFDLLGRYPVHWHHVGNGAGQYYRRSTITYSENRCMSVHNTNSMEISNNVCVDHKGHGFILEDGSEINNSFLRNLVIGTRKASGKLIASDDEAPNAGAITSAFWTMNANNIFRENVAAGVDGAGFTLELDRNVFEKQRRTTVEDYILNESDYDALRRMPFQEFSNNMAHSVASTGFWIGQLYEPNDGTTLTNLQAYKIFGSRGNMPACFWFHSFGTYLSRMICSDFPRAMWPIFRSVISDSVFVAFSNNIGDPQPGRSRTLQVPSEHGFVEGLSIYDGPSVYLRLHFENFFDVPDAPNSPNTGLRARHVRIFGGSFSSTKNLVSGLTFKNPSTLVVGPSANNESRAQIEDLDGSLSKFAFGTAVQGANLLNPILVNGAPIMDPQRNDGTCVWYPPEQRYLIICRKLEAARAVLFWFRNMNGENHDARNERINFGVFGDSLRQRVIIGREVQNDFEVTLVHGTISEVEFLSFKPEKFYYWVNSGGTFGDSYETVLKMTPGLPYTVHGAASYKSLAETRAASDSSRYYHDIVTGRIHIIVQMIRDELLTDENRNSLGIATAYPVEVAMLSLWDQSKLYSPHNGMGYLDFFRSNQGRLCTSQMKSGNIEILAAQKPSTSKFPINSGPEKATTIACSGGTCFVAIDGQEVVQFTRRPFFAAFNDIDFNFVAERTTCQTLTYQLGIQPSTSALDAGTFTFDLNEQHGYRSNLPIDRITTSANVTLRFEINAINGNFQVGFQTQQSLFQFYFNSDGSIFVFTDSKLSHSTTRTTIKSRFSLRIFSSDFQLLDQTNVLWSTTLSNRQITRLFVSSSRLSSIRNMLLGVVSSTPGRTSTSRTSTQSSISTMSTLSSIRNILIDPLDVVSAGELKTDGLTAPTLYTLASVGTVASVALIGIAALLVIKRRRSIGRPYSYEQRASSRQSWNSRSTLSSTSKLTRSTTRQS